MNLDLELLGVVTDLLRGLRPVSAHAALQLDYQPEALVGTGAVVGVEALLRLRFADATVVGPQELVPLMTAAGLSGRLDHAVLGLAAEQARLWSELHRGGTVPRIWVNVSLSTLAAPAAAASILGLLWRHGVPAGWVGLEVPFAAGLAAAAGSLDDVIAELHQGGVAVGADGVRPAPGLAARLPRLDSLVLHPDVCADLVTPPPELLGAVHELRATGAQVVAGSVASADAPGLWALGVDRLRGSALSAPLGADQAGWVLRAPARV